MEEARERVCREERAGLLVEGVVGAAQQGVDEVRSRADLRSGSASQARHRIAVAGYSFFAETFSVAPASSAISLAKLSTMAGRELNSSSACSSVGHTRQVDTSQS